MKKNLQGHLKWFDNYAKSKIKSSSVNPKPIEIKQQHSLRVLQNALLIRDPASTLSEETISLAALYHDLARFNQYLQFGTFKDSISRNHGAWAVKILKQEKLLRDMPQKQARQIMSAICLHNRAMLPKNLKGETLELCEIIRDADKLDILKVMDEHLAAQKSYDPTVILGLPDTNAPGNSAIPHKIFKREVAYYSDLKTLNDFRLLLGSWFFDMHFNGSKRLFIQNGNARKILMQLPEDSHYREAKNFLLQELENNGN